MPKDLVKAKQYVERGMAGGNTNALVELARYHRDGLGVPKDLPKAVSYLKKAVELGSASGMNELGWHHRDGLGVQRDDQEALPNVPVAGSKLGPSPSSSVSPHRMLPETRLLRSWSGSVDRVIGLDRRPRPLADLGRVHARLVEAGAEAEDS